MIKNNGITLLDKAIKRISPIWYFKRAKSRFLASTLDSAYDGGSNLKRSMRRWNAPSGDGNAAFSEGTQNVLVSRCRDAYRNYALAKAVVDRIKLNSIGTGIRLQSKINADKLGITRDHAAELEKRIEGHFESWSKKCDVEDSINFSCFQILIQVSMLISGDVFVNTVYLKRKHDDEYFLKLQAIESDRVSNPKFGFDSKKIIRGVEVDSYGRPSFYHITKEHPYSQINNESEKYIWQRFPVYGKNTGRKRILHIFDKAGEGRPGLKRGIPYLSPILELLRQLSKYTESELTAAVISSFFSIFVKSESGMELPGNTQQTYNEEEKGEITLGPGAIVDLLPNESIEVANPGRPNDKYEPFVLAILKSIGAATNIPFEVLIQHFSSSYSASKAAILQAWQLFKYQRSIIISYFCQPTYELFLDELVASGKLDLPDYAEKRDIYSKSSWIGPNGGSIDPFKEANAAEKRIKIGISTIQRESEEIVGMDWMDIHRQRSIEKKIRVESGLEEGIEKNNKNEPDI